MDPKLTKFQAAAPHILRVCFDDQSSGEVWISGLLNEAEFVDLADFDLFKTVKTDPADGDFIVWERPAGQKPVRIETKKLYQLAQVADGRLIIRGKTSELHRMELAAKYLRTESWFHYAAEIYRKMLRLKPGNPKWLKELAGCIYKDPNLPASKKYDEALHFLGQAVDLENTRDSEFLGVAGAIYKRKWQYDNQYQNLLFSEHFYKRGMENWQAWQGFYQKKPAEKPPHEDDNGYCAINFAYIQDLMATARFKETDGLKTAGVSQHALDRLKTGQDCRQEIIKNLLGAGAVSFKNIEKNIPPLQNVPGFNIKWVNATLGEAYFSTGEYAGAQYFFKKYLESTGLKDWEKRSTAEQLAGLATLHFQLAGLAKKHLDRTGNRSEILDKLPFLEDPETVSGQAQNCLRLLYPTPGNASDDKNQDISFRGKVGLALSGGGFRASLYHIGVLARLAELDILRNVEVLSCVSGGSIAGAYYYLLLKKEVDEINRGDKKDSAGNAVREIDYTGLVKKMETGFLAATQQNLRMHIFSHLPTNFKIFFSKNYSRTHRIGDLYERFLYNDLWKDEQSAGHRLLMHHLKIAPLDWPTGAAFNPKTDNWNRKDKVPMLVLNATSLNTGHNWQFTASWMGEPPGNIQQDVDAKPRLRRMYYHEAPAPYRNNVRVGHAVGASACVPGLFEPLAMPGLYPGLDLQLVDGGVHDNQGIASLLEQECKVMIVSDASGQMPDDAHRTDSDLSVLARADTIFQERIRENQFLDLKSREEAVQINALVFVHLKKDLQSDPVNWKFCQEPPRTAVIEEQLKTDAVTSYGILRDVQQELSMVRTDLDAFNEAEACALMYSGYAQTRQTMGRQRFAFLANGKNNADRTLLDWDFLKMAKWMEKPELAPILIKRLKIGQQQFFKVFRTGRKPAAQGIAVLLVAVALILAVVYGLFSGKSWTIDLWTLAKFGGGILLTYLVTAFVSKILAEAMNWKTWFVKKIGLAFSALFLFFFFWLYLRIFNQAYLDFGKLAAMEKEAEKSK